MRPHLAALAVGALAGVCGAGCAVGNVRAGRMGALGPYRELPVRVEPVRGVRRDRALAAAVEGGLERGLEAWNRARAPKQPQVLGPLRALDPPPALIVLPEVVDAYQGQAEAGGLAEGVAAATSVFGLFDGVDASRLTLRLSVFAPGEPEALGGLTWEGAAGGSLDAFVARASAEAGSALAARLKAREDQFVTRRASDERFLLAPSALLLEPGELAVSNDEVLLFHLGVGVTRWLELHLTLGGLPLPAAGGFPIVAGGAGAAGGAGLAVVAAFDLGFRVRLLEETDRWPGVAAGYDLVDAFGAALGGGGVVFAGTGVAAGAAAGAAGVNVQLNVLHVEANKHFGPINVGGGAALFDNHHLLPQSAAFVAATSTGAGTTGGSEVELLPEVLVPFLDFEFTPVEWFRMIQELYPRLPAHDSFGVTGLRFVLGPEGTAGPLALDKVRLRFDLGLLEAYQAASATVRRPGAVVLPWLGLGLYFL